MNEEKPAEEVVKKSGTSCWKVGLIILAIIIFIMIVLSVLGFRLFLYPVALISDYFNKSETAEESSVSVEKYVDPELVSDWETDCKVPDPDSDWAEKHYFTIRSDGTAVHHRWSGSSCATMQDDGADDYSITIPNPGQINFTYVSGSTFYDIYQVNGDILYFGHGFCNCSTGLATGNFGGTQETRFSILNTYLDYHRK